MALFKSNTLTQVSGSVEGTTYTRTKSGMVMRARSNPTDPKTVNQRTRRTAMRTANEMWHRQLNAAQRRKWAEYARNVPRDNALGDAKELSGQQAFVSAALLISLGQLSNQLDAPQIFDRPGFTSSLNLPVQSPTNLEVFVQLTIDNEVTDSAQIFIYTGRPINKSRRFYKGPWQYNNNFTVTDDTINIFAIDATNGVDTKYNYDIGTTLFLKLVCLTSDNRVSSEQILGPTTLV